MEAQADYVLYPSGDIGATPSSDGCSLCSPEDIGDWISPKDNGVTSGNYQVVAFLMSGKCDWGTFNVPLSLAQAHDWGVHAYGSASMGDQHDCSFRLDISANAAPLTVLASAYVTVSVWTGP